MSDQEASSSFKMSNNERMNKVEDGKQVEVGDKKLSINDLPPEVKH